ncbi:toxic anion resistance protein [Mitsuaria sp. GD03876]|uniref:toxic anion resistance protein n=1 Tax=Mitsuaria sp. GD03876 TaxID=2975399 RepID=UPI00244BBDC6|nr:toxic anion resistance protein [Mitsuaria sp. GD03876]MDH0866491.1 toxic anion resistance protein [Mitsuaria sp. GD03876]
MTASQNQTTTTAAPTALDTLQPPQAFTLEPPAPVQVVPAEAAAGKVRLKPEDVAELDGQVRQFIDDITTHDAQHPTFKQAVERIHAMGNKDIEAAASASNRMLDRPVGSLKNGILDQGAQIGQSLIDLRRTVEDLDPSRQGDLFSARKLLGFIPMGNKLADYFDRYQSSQAHLNAIIEALKGGKDELMRDNAAIEQEKVNLWTLMERLEKYIHIGKTLDGQLDAKAKALDLVDGEKARVVREEMLFYTRQKVTDLLTQQAVNIQGYLALDLIRKNNLELIKGVDRATTTTVSALRTAVIVAQALNNQKLVLDQISALNTTTGNLIAGTSELLRDQSAAIHQQAASSTIEIAKLQQAFTNIYQTMDTIADFKTKALASMQTTVDVLSDEVAKSKTYLDRVRRQESAAALQASGEVSL